MTRKVQNRGSLAKSPKQLFPYRRNASGFETLSAILQRRADGFHLVIEIKSVTLFLYMPESRLAPIAVGLVLL